MVGFITLSVSVVHPVKNKDKITIFILLLYSKFYPCHQDHIREPFLFFHEDSMQLLQSLHISNLSSYSFLLKIRAVSFSGSILHYLGDFSRRNAGGNRSFKTTSCRVSLRKRITIKQCWNTFQHGQVIWWLLYFDRCPYGGLQIHWHRRKFQQGDLLRERVFGSFQ